MKLIKFLKSVGADLFKSVISPFLIWSLVMVGFVLVFSTLGFISSLCGFVLYNEGQPAYFATGSLYVVGLLILTILFVICEATIKYIKDKWNKS